MILALSVTAGVLGGAVIGAAGMAYYIFGWVRQ